MVEDFEENLHVLQLRLESLEPFIEDLAHSWANDALASMVAFED
jgi:hypothetical protein